MFIYAALSAAVTAAAFLGLRRAHATLTRIELFALWWSIALAATALGAMVWPSNLLMGLAGVLMVGLGLFLALDAGGIAIRLGTHRTGVVWTQQSPRYWRFSGGFLAAVGTLWALALGPALG